MKRVVLARAVWKILGVRGIVVCVTKGIRDFLRSRGLAAACAAQISFGAKSVATGGRSWEWAETGVEGTLDGCLGGV